ncbi:hypothetical protein COLO4_14371 [Corchorus olitorius]|uniref:CCT domain-containing protein n=1 Tax=Corchorus olitorius TaxID=93759 RepID=A0A1R3JSB7_9ROSI|nr:hypothetical protein COLO4_14371 [Corchorus olitorius]
MGEVVVSSEEVEEVRTESETEKDNGDFEEKKEEKRKKKKQPGNSASVEMVKWEKFLPRMALRVLLVEADDSTRQIIAALLRKCSYRVATVPDGLKAWEMLKGNPHNVDLILTEVDLPSISGFALLTLIMEHEICKSIPVIMMSSQDSISTVYKCMLRGAADYLVKPIRRNELRNLWQHSIVGGNSPQDESVGQKKVEATSENNAASNHSSGCMPNVQRNKEQTEKGSDAQSSCTKPEMEAESAHMENMQEISRLIEGKSLPSESQKHEACPNINQKPLLHETKTGDTPSTTPTSQRSMIHLTTGTSGQLKQTEVAASSTQQRVFPVPVPVKGISFETNNSGQLYDRLASNTNQSTNQPLHKLDRFDSIEDRGHISPTTDQSASSSFCNGSLSQLNSIGYGSAGASNGNLDQVSGVRAPPESKNDDNFLSPSGNSHRSIQREAALTKFRLKRKDRCYEKKVRYESRKKLAEQRPRVKGQFVRQVQADPTHTEAECQYGNSSNG